MKVAFATDHLLTRDDQLFLMESLFGFFPDAAIYCCAHNQEQVVGPVALRSIHSTFLSRMVTDLEQLREKFYMIPSAISQLEIDPELDLLICLSRGLAHKFKVSAKTQKVVYFLDPYPYERGQSWLKRKFFGAHFEYWKRKSESKLPIYSGSYLKKVFHDLALNKVLAPAVKGEDFQIVENDQRKGVLVYCSISEIPFLKKLAEQLKQPIIAFGEGIEERSEGEFFHQLEVGCDGVFASQLNSVSLFINTVQTGFPSLSVQALLSGVPVLQRDSAAANEHLYNNESFEVGFFNQLEELQNKVNSFQQKSFDPKLARRWALGMNERKFKHQFKLLLDKSLKPQDSVSVSQVSVETT